MRPTVTDVAWSASAHLFVGYNRELYKNGWTDWDADWVWTWVGHRNNVLHGARSPQGKGQFWETPPAHCEGHGVRSIFSTLFSRRQRRCGLSLSLLQQLVWLCATIPIRENCHTRPDNVICVPSLSNFRQRLKTLLFQASFPATLSSITLNLFRYL